MEIRYRPIGVIHSPFQDPEEMPVQPRSGGSRRGTIEVEPEYSAGLQDLDGFSHVILIVHLHRVDRSEVEVVPFLDSSARGVFATRAPTRPNQIGLSVVDLEGIDGNVVRVAGLDLLDGTPVLDIKPYVPAVDSVPEARSGWLEGLDDRIREARADGRFT